LIKKQIWIAFGVLAVLPMASNAFATVTLIGRTANTIDYSFAGSTPFGADGYLFANWDTNDVSSGEESLNEVNTLPSWFQIENDQNFVDYAWANAENVTGPNPVGAPYTSNVIGYGGDTTFATLTLPDGTTGLSGQYIDTTEAGE
jgi:hypothetical protein